MIATLSYGGSRQNKRYRIAIGKADRGAFKGYGFITVNIDGLDHRYPINDCFWENCAHVDDTSKSHAIEEWGTKNGLIPWTKGKPPKVRLESKGNGKFELSTL